MDSSIVVTRVGKTFRRYHPERPATLQELRTRYPDLPDDEVARRLIDRAAKTAAGEQDWSPNFIDYLFLAFNTSTAFSPADAMVLSRWAKILMMIQTMISLLVITLLAARAVSII